VENGDKARPHVSTKVGQIRVSEYKFVGERVVESLWPLGLIPSPWKFYAIIGAYFVFGASLVLAYSIPLVTFIAGTCTGLGVTLWTWALFKYAENFRRTEIFEMNRAKYKFMSDFLESVFSDFPLTMAILLYVGTVAYFFTFGSHVMDKIVPSALPSLGKWVVYCYVLVLAFDLNFRISMTLYVSLVVHRRNWKLARLLQREEFAVSFSRLDLEGLIRIDRYLLPMIGSQVFFYPLSFFDINLSWLLSSYIALITGSALVSLLYLASLRNRYSS
jgi:hypothetical protein